MFFTISTQFFKKNRRHETTIMEQIGIELERKRRGGTKRKRVHDNRKKYPI